jgi:hypothetical protein
MVSSFRRSLLRSFEVSVRFPLLGTLWWMDAGVPGATTLAALALGHGPRPQPAGTTRAGACEA